jgi:hypothetical protein
MKIHLKVMGGILSKVVDEGFVIINEANPAQANNENILANAQDMNVIIRALCIHEYHRVCKFDTAHEMWRELIEAHEGTSNVKSAKLFIYKGKFEKFALLPNEELKDNFSHLNNIVNELKDLRFDVPEFDISHKYLRALPPKYEAIVTMLVRSNLKTIPPSEVLGEVLTHDIFKQSHEELHGNLYEDKKKIIVFKAKTSNDDDHDGDSETSTDDDVALMVKKFKRFMKNKDNQSGSSRSGKSYSKNPFAKKKCFECGKISHISTNCKNKDEDNSSKKKKFEGKQKLLKKYNKKKNGKACYVEWDSDASSDSNSDDDENDEKPSKKDFASIAIKEAPSLFETPYCLMVKGEPKVCEIDKFTSDDLVEMVSNLDNLLGDMEGKYKILRKKHVSVQEYYEELKTSHKTLLDTHEKLKEAYISHISQEANKVKVDVGIIYDLIDDMPKIDKVSKSSISTSCDDLLAMPCSSNIDSCMNDSPCDPLLIVKNHELRNITDCLTKALENYHRGENTYNKMWECQRFTLKHEGLGYIPKKNKSAFIDKKTTFMKECGLYCSKCKNSRHLDKDCTNSKTMNVSIDPSYVHVKSSKGDVYAKFVANNRNHAHISNNGIGTKRKSISVPKALVTNL